MLRSERKHHRGVLGPIVLVLLFGAVIIGAGWWFFAGRLPSRIILEADLGRPVVEQVPDQGAGRLFLGGKPELRGIVETLEQAAQDSRVKAFVARLGEGGLKLAQVQELRDAVIAFRASGKPAIAYAETFGEAGPGNGSYYLGTAFDRIYLQPSGAVGFTGLIAEQPFLRGALDKLGIVPRVDGRKEYKSLRYLFTERKYLPPHREAVSTVLRSQFSQIVRAVAERRKLGEDEVRGLADDGPFIGKDAVDARLVDGLAYRDEVYAKVQEQAGKKAKRIDLAEYARRTGSLHRSGTTIALIYAVGSIERGPSGFRPVTGELIMGSDTIAEALRAAAEDSDVKAILLRIDSPGGSYVASDAIWRETVAARKAGKPVIVSMGATAGSGGYFIAVAADRIVAQPATVTGSIGVLGGKLVTTGFWNKLGITWDEVHTSENADVWSQAKDLSPAQRRRMELWLDGIYADFVAKVASGRKMNEQDVERAAKGRIWTGEDAWRLGLVDELGGFPAALRAVRRSLKLGDDAPLEYKLYPEPKPFWKRIRDLDLAAAAADRNNAILREAAEELQPAARALEALGNRSRVLAMPEAE